MSAQDSIRENWERLRRQGIWPIPIWVPGGTAYESAREAHPQLAPVATSEQDFDDQAFVDDATYGFDLIV